MSLPLDIFLPIVDALDPDYANLPDIYTLSNISRTCRFLHSLLLPELYRVIRLPLGTLHGLLVSPQDSRAIKLSQTLSRNGRLANLVQEIEITASWLPKDGMERAREAYIAILNSCSRVKATAFMISRGEYEHVLQVEPREPKPQLRSLTIGLDRYDHLGTIPLLNKGPSDYPELAPNLVHLQIFIPPHLRFPRSEDLFLVPTTIQYLDICCEWTSSVDELAAAILHLLQRRGLKVLTIVLPHDTINDEQLETMLNSDDLMPFTQKHSSSAHITEPIPSYGSGSGVLDKDPSPRLRIVFGAAPTPQWIQAHRSPRETPSHNTSNTDEFGIDYGLPSARVGRDYHPELMLLWWRALADPHRRAIIEQTEGVRAHRLGE